MKVAKEIELIRTSLHENRKEFISKVEEDLILFLEKYDALGDSMLEQLSLEQHLGIIVVCNAMMCGLKGMKVQR